MGIKRKSKKHNCPKANQKAKNKPPREKNDIEVDVLREN